MFGRLAASWTIAAVALLATGAPLALAQGSPTATSQLLKQDVLIASDMWKPKPKMLAGGLGFTEIIGVPGISTDDLAGSEQAVRAAGGTWNTISCAPGATPALAAYTSANSPQTIATAFGYPTTYSDGLPVEFSWPVRPSTLDPTDFQVTLNTGEAVTPELAAVSPNLEYNERGVAVLFGEFGNRIPSTEPGTQFPTRVEVVGDETPLQLVGPDGPVSAVGMGVTNSVSPYDDVSDPDERTGPHLAAAKLTEMSDAGEGAPAVFSGALPNDGITLYGSKADYRLRVYTTGGFKPDGVRGVFPTDFERFFRVHATDSKGRDHVLDEEGERYAIDGGHVKVVGLADLGVKQDSYDDCYQDDSDNQIDIVLAGDRRAVKTITHVEIPATGRYSPYYNPGGPGNDPTPGVNYSAPGPTEMQKVWRSLKDPHTVTFRPSPRG